MFQNVEQAPLDAILGLTEAFKNDTNPNKINLSVGVYKDATGNTPIQGSVQEALKRVLAAQTSKAYLPIPGAADYSLAVQKLLFGAEHEVVSSARAATSHTPGGTAALRVAGDFIKNNLAGATLWLSNPTWANHPAIFKAAGLPTKTYDYFNAETNCLDFEAMKAAIQKIPAGDVLLLHGCCHNPTGVDPSDAQWQQLADLVTERGILPLLDFAYQGFAEGIEEDAVGIRTFAKTGKPFLVCSSFSKNFGLYRERVGAMTVVATDKAEAEKVQSQVKRCIRTNYSNPPSHGGEIVTTILNDPQLRAQWEIEVAEMRARINTMRTLFVETLAAKGVAGDYSFITQQRGMFSFSGLTKEQVATLREQYAIYIVGSGRINVAGITASNVELLCESIAQVM